MYISTEGAYIALGDHFLILFRAVGEYPYFKIPSGIILNEYAATGELRVVKENSMEIQDVLTNPRMYAFARISSIAEGLIPVNYIDSSEVQFDEEKINIWIERLQLIDKPNSGLNINSLVMDIVRELGYSRPQALLMIQEIRKQSKCKKNERSVRR